MGILTRIKVRGFRTGEQSLKRILLNAKGSARCRELAIDTNVQWSGGEGPGGYLVRPSPLLLPPPISLSSQQLVFLLSSLSLPISSNFRVPCM